MSYNKIIMMGRLTRNPELRTIPSGTPVCEFGVAADSGWGDNKKTCFIDVTVWGKQAEFVSKYFMKGDGIHIEGRLDFDIWEDKNGGGKRSKHRITAERVTWPTGAPRKGLVTDGHHNSGGGTTSGWNSQQEIDEIPF